MMRECAGMATPDFIQAVWRKSSRSGNGGNCVEVAALDRLIGIRDSKNPAGPVLLLTPRSWARLVHGMRNAASNE
jgi:hypothetical protein